MLRTSLELHESALKLSSFGSFDEIYFRADKIKPPHWSKGTRPHRRPEGQYPRKIPSCARLYDDVTKDKVKQRKKSTERKGKECESIKRKEKGTEEREGKGRTGNERKENEIGKGRNEKRNRREE